MKSCCAVSPVEAKPNSTSPLPLRMSASSNSSQGHDPPASTLDKGVVQINFSTKPPPPLQRRITSFQGFCPLDTPLWDAQTLDCHDRRNMSPWTLWFVGPLERAGGKFHNRHDEIRRGIWNVVAQEMTKHSLSGPLPIVIIDEDHLDDVKTRGSVEVIFHDATIFTLMVNCMFEIRIQEPGGRLRPLPLRCFSNSLERGVLPFDLLRFPLAAVDSKALLQSLNTMLEGVGSVLGIGKLDHVPGSLGIPPGHSGLLRFYVRLPPTTMALDFRAYALKLPTHFKWNGIAYVMQYNGRDMHDVQVHSADFPLEEEVSANDLGSTTSSSAPASSSSSSTLVESSEEANKRKRSRK